MCRQDRARRWCGCTASGFCGTDIAATSVSFRFIAIRGFPDTSWESRCWPSARAWRTSSRAIVCSVEPYYQLPGLLFLPAGRTNCCQKLQVLGVHCDGGLRPRILCARPQAASLGENSRSSSSLWSRRSASAAMPSIRATPQPDEAVLVIGAGPIGLSVLEFVKLTGATDHGARSQHEPVRVLPPGHGDREHNSCEGGRLRDRPFGGDRRGHAADGCDRRNGERKSMSAAFQYVGHTGKLVFVGITTKTFHSPIRCFTPAR